jgi:hypothetical protein
MAYALRDLNIPMELCYQINDYVKNIDLYQHKTKFQATVDYITNSYKRYYSKFYDEEKCGENNWVPGYYINNGEKRKLYGIYHKRHYQLKMPERVPYATLNNTCTHLDEYCAHSVTFYHLTTNAIKKFKYFRDVVIHLRCDIRLEHKQYKAMKIIARFAEN